MRATVWLATAALSLGACVATPEPEAPGDPEVGQTVAQNLCVSCHATDSTTASPNPAAPPLSTVLANYPADMLAADLHRSVNISHLKMPRFFFGEHQVADLVAYLKQIQED